MRKQKAEAIKVGNVVIVHEDNVRRNRLDKIERLTLGSGGIVLGAAVKVGERDKKSTVIQRPVQKRHTTHTTH